VLRRGISKSTLSALEALSRASATKNFYLAGGTAAALQLGHRLSLDLDFFAPRAFESEKLSSQLEHLGLELSEIELAPRTLHCTVTQTKVSFLHYPFPLLQVTETFQGVTLASLMDIALMKFTAIASRGSKKDFIDLYFLLKKLDLSELWREFPRKFPVEKLDPYHYLKSLTDFEDAEGDPMPKMLTPCRWPDVRREIEKQVARLEL